MAPNMARTKGWQSPIRRAVLRWERRAEKACAAVAPVAIKQSGNQAIGQSGNQAIKVGLEHMWHTQKEAANQRGAGGRAQELRKLLGLGWALSGG
eukprot:1705332-Prymnesium_polylepis.1